MLSFQRRFRRSITLTLKSTPIVAEGEGGGVSGVVWGGRTGGGVVVAGEIGRASCRERVS